jgi:molybdate transport system permease protein
MFNFTAEEIDAIRLSLWVASIGIAASLPFGLAVAYILARWRFPGKILLDALVHMPLVLPPVVTGYILLILFGRRGAIGAWLEQTFGIVFSFRWTGAALAAAVMGFPLMVRAIRLSLESTDRRLEDASRMLGANRVTTFFLVTLPLALPGIIAGLVLAFAKALGEFGATITFVSNIPGETRTLPSAIYTFTQVPGGDAGAFRLAAVAMLIAIAALVMSELLARRTAARIEG